MLHYDETADHFLSPCNSKQKITSSRHKDLVWLLLGECLSVLVHRVAYTVKEVDPKMKVSC